MFLSLFDFWDRTEAILELTASQADFELVAILQPVSQVLGFTGVSHHI